MTRRSFADGDVIFRDIVGEGIAPCLLEERGVDRIRDQRWNRFASSLD